MAVPDVVWGDVEQVLDILDGSDVSRVGQHSVACDAALLLAASAFAGVVVWAGGSRLTLIQLVAIVAIGCVVVVGCRGERHTELL